jgi:hypothetical protein
MAEHNGVSLPILDPLASWAPQWTSGVSDPAWMEFLGYAPDDFFRIAGELQASTMTVIGTFSPGRVPIGQVTESFAALADKAAGYGLHCVLEFIPIWGIGDLATAWAVTTPCCDPFQGTRSPTYRLPTRRRHCLPVGRFLMIACFTVCLPVRANYRSNTFSKY